jgi:diguanylate cyclase (GGDEF)-like protein
MKLTTAPPESVSCNAFLDVLNLLKSVTGICNWAVTQHTERGSRLIAFVGSRELASQIASRDGCYQGQCAFPRTGDQNKSTCLRIPLSAGDNEPDLGTLCGFGTAERQSPYIDWDAAYSGARLVSSLLSAIEEKRRLTLMLSEAENAANQDGMSGAWNRRAWERLTAMHMQRQIRDPRPGFVVLIDLDGLKEVNDTEGHAAGDSLIKQAADTLARSIRPYDVLARLGGDEFAILLPDCAMKGRYLRRRLQTALKEAGVAASIGLAPLRSDLKAALETADRRMYRHKRWHHRRAMPDS